MGADAGAGEPGSGNTTADIADIIQSTIGTSESTTCKQFPTFVSVFVQRARTSADTNRNSRFSGSSADWWAKCSGPLDSNSAELESYIRNDGTPAGVSPWDCACRSSAAAASTS